MVLKNLFGSDISNFAKASQPLAENVNKQLGESGLKDAVSTMKTLAEFSTKTAKPAIETFKTPAGADGVQKLVAAFSQLGDFTKAVTPIANKVNKEVGSEGLQKVMTLSSHVAIAATFATYTGAFATIYQVCKDPEASKAQKAFARQLDEVSGKLSAIDESTFTTANIAEQTDFAKAVHAFVLQQTKLYQESDPKPISDKNDSLEASHKGHYFFIYHPANNWHPYFDNIREKEGDDLPGFVGYSTDRYGLGMYLRVFREAVGPEPVFHLLVPSAHRYRLPGVINVHPSLHPFVIHGQTAHDGQPYCSATITGLDASNIVSLRMLPVPGAAEDHKGGYSATSTNISFGYPRTLSANCVTYSNKYNSTSINLDKYLGVEAGKFKVGGSNFSKRAFDTKLDPDGVTLRASVVQPDGSSKENAINLESFISNRGGELMGYGELSALQIAGSGVSGTVGGVIGGGIGSIAGPAGVGMGATLGAFVAGAAADKHQKDSVKK